MIAELEEIPLDILKATKEHIDYYIGKSNPSGVLIGTASSVPGATSLTIANPSYLDRYGVIVIDDGSNNEIHQVEDNDAGVFQLNKNLSSQVQVKESKNGIKKWTQTSY